MTHRKLIGHVPVDSGQVLIVDPCYLKEWKDGDFDPERSDDLPAANHYDAACRLSVGDEPAGQLNFENVTAVVSGSGYGDGDYPVYATIKDGRVQKLEIIFYGSEKEDA